MSSKVENLLNACVVQLKHADEKLQNVLKKNEEVSLDDLQDQFLFRNEGFLVPSDVLRTLEVQHLQVEHVAFKALQESAQTILKTMCEERDALQVKIRRMSASAKVDISANIENVQKQHEEESTKLETKKAVLEMKLETLRDENHTFEAEEAGPFEDDLKTQALMAGDLERKRNELRVNVQRLEVALSSLFDEIKTKKANINPDQTEKKIIASSKGKKRRRKSESFRALQRSKKRAEILQETVASLEGENEDILGGVILSTRAHLDELLSEEKLVFAQMQRHQSSQTEWQAKLCSVVRLNGVASSAGVGSAMGHVINAIKEERLYGLDDLTQSSPSRALAKKAVAELVLLGILKKMEGDRYILPVSL